MKRMKKRGWTENQINKRIKTDKSKFKDFIDYNLTIQSI